MKVLALLGILISGGAGTVAMSPEVKEKAKNKIHEIRENRKQRRQEKLDEHLTDEEMTLLEAKKAELLAQYDFENMTKEEKFEAYKNIREEIKLYLTESGVELPEREPLLTEEEKELINKLEETLTHPIMGIIPCYCDVLKAKRDHFSFNPDCPFNIRLERIVEKLI